MPDDTPTGIPNPDMPGDWLVPPWPTSATFSDVVRHFVSYHQLRNTNTAHLVAYFEGFQAALEAARADEWTDAMHLRWCATMRDCVTRCARLHREQRMAEIQRANDRISKLPTHQIPTFQEKAS
ncbi:MAG TPA: hypothetical protein VFE14_14165 [Micromonosporaceae bacterium]|jgi:hypothetical protein|nr:hypothetical protein [Micromonosporaceae bacterium]